MGRSESSTVIIGSRFELTDLVSVVNENNLEKIMLLLVSDEIYIDDDNGMFNTNYKNIIDELDPVKTLEDFHAFMELLKKHGDIVVYRSGEHKPVFHGYYDENTPCLFNQTFIHVIDEPLYDLTRWGYSREGYNVSSVALNKIDFQKAQDNIKKMWGEIGFVDYTITLTTIVYTS